MKERLKYLREHLGLNQREFSSKINVSQPALAMMENGQRPVRDIYISQICSTFNVNEDWFRNGEGEIFISSKELYSDIIYSALKRGDEQIKDLIIEATDLNEVQLRNLIDFIRSMKQ